MKQWSDFSEVWAFDWEYSAPDGEVPRPVCLAALETRSGRRVELWQDELKRLYGPPFRTDERILFVCYYGVGDLQCFLALGWPLPIFLIDLYSEYTARTNGLIRPHGRGLVGASLWYGLPPVEEKESNRALILRGGWNQEERSQIRTYCMADVCATAALLDAMGKRGHLDFPAALLRGRYTAAVARMESCGIPIDVATHTLLCENWLSIQDGLIQRVDEPFGVYDGRTFKLDRWERYLKAHRIVWPRTPKGRIATDDDSFKEGCRAHPQLEPLRQLRKTLAQMRLSDLPIGCDGRNRVMLSPLSTTTGRNAPSTSKFVFGLAAWLRSLIRPQPGMALAYVDWSQQEFGVAAALSGDDAMLSAYLSGDPYLALAKQCGAVPRDATRETHPLERDRFKALVLAVNYQMSAPAVAMRLGVSLVEGQQYLALHHRVYCKFWRWSDGAHTFAFTRRRLSTVFGWPIHVTSRTKERSIRNFPCQANAAEMMRLAACRIAEAGVRIAAPVHDAFLIEAPAAELDDAVATTQREMARASVDVLRTLELRSDVKVIRYPDRYRDPRGAAMWQEVSSLLPVRAVG